MHRDKALKPGTTLETGKFSVRLNELLTNDSQGFLYRGTATTHAKGKEKPRASEVVVREHFMSYCSERGDDGITVVTPEDIAPTVNGCLEHFRQASMMRGKIAEGHPAIINVLDSFDANNTYYYMVEFLDGPTLEEYVNANGPLTLDKTREILCPIFSAVSHFHADHTLHTDIHPRHIRFTSHAGQSKPVLFSLYTSIHFDESGHKLWSVQNTNCRSGYAPPEQYTDIDHFLPQIDIYALAATMVFVMTGKHLPDSRTINEEIVRTNLPLALPEVYASALIHALSPDYGERTVSITGFFDELQLSYDVDQRAHRPTDEHEIASADEPGYGRQIKTMTAITVLAIIATIIVLIGLF